MYLKTSGGLLDGELQILREFLELIDGRLELLSGMIATSADPDAEGLCERGDYLIGIGFVAVQQYLYDTCICVNINKEEAFKYGPAHSTGTTWVRLVHEAANWWKHEAEWFKKNEVRKTTFNIVYDVIKTESYPMSNVLAAFTESKCLTFVSVISRVMEWRDVLATNKALQIPRRV
ncbi:hypothetical protein [Pseudomonas promysalinigenes]|uniref:hypothetical protein n=1 Tax=Pseudomonas promysalinigenes TaxID=485898 RepID=UPI003F9F95C7